MSSTAFLPLRLHDVLTALHERGRDVTDGLIRELGVRGQLRRHLAGRDPRIAAALERERPVDPLLRALDDRIDRIEPADRRLTAAATVTSILAEVATADGVIDQEEAVRRFGPRASSLLLRVRELVAQGAARSAMPSGAKYAGIDMATAVRMSAGASSDDLAARMPVLAELVRNWDDPQAFAGWAMASMGHLFATTPALYKAIEALGLAREDHEVGGKGYSRHPEVVVRMAGEAFHVDEGLLNTYDYDKRSSMEEKRAVMQLEKLFEGVDPSDASKRFLLLDDGGFLTVALHEHPHLAKYAHMCRAVEQTAHGIMRIQERLLDKGIELLIPVVDAARSDLKKIFESPMIGEAVVSSIERQLASVHRELCLEPRQAMLAGFGAVNQAVAQALLRRGWDAKDIWVHDIDDAKMEAARTLGFSATTREEALSHAHLYVSATGHTTLTPPEFDLLPDGAVAANAGSGNHELGMHERELHASSVHEPVEGGRYFRRGGEPTSAVEPEVRVPHYVDQAWRLLDGRGLVPVKKAAILGFDADGEAALAALVQRGVDPRRVWVCEADPGRAARARALGCQVADFDAAVGKAAVVLAGQRESIQIRRAMALIEGGGAFVNYGRLAVPVGREAPARGDEDVAKVRADWLHDSGEWGGRFRGYNVSLGEGGPDTGYRHRVLRTGTGKETLVLRSGFVVNMQTGIVPEYAQLILGMLLACCLQATRETKPGIIAMDGDLQRFVEARVRAFLSRLARTLEVPNFDGLPDAVY